MARVCFALMTLVWMIVAGNAAAQGAGTAPHLAMRLVAETSAPAPGSSVALAFDALPQPGWHGYWENVGDAGVPMTLDWRLPPGVEAGALRYPVPQRLTVAGLMNYVFERPYAILTTLRIPADAAKGSTIPVSVEADYLVCTEKICVPESQTLSTVLTVGEGRADRLRTKQFDQWRRALPQPLGAPGHYAAADGRVRIAIPYPASAALGDDAYFYPLTHGAIDYAAAQTVVRAGDRLIVETKTGGAWDGAVAGVLDTGTGTSLRVEAVRGAVPAARSDMRRTVLLAFLGALVGGLILNVMPCVFPILSLKALALARANVDARESRREALAYTAGVVLVCVALGGALLAVRAGGSAAGWAFQLQDPRVILFLLILVTGIALNLAGLFELSLPGLAGRGAGESGAFATGALAAFVATPCTGPFLGAALGAALLLPWYGALLIFFGLGLGLALPFLAIGFLPGLRRRLPRPGPWMATLRRILSVPMFLTALALAWILGRQAGVDGMTLGLGAALGVALSLWWAGMRQRRGRGALAAVVPLLLLTAAAIGLVRPAPSRAEVAEAAVPGAEPFSEARLAELRRQGRPVFAYFTADWCLTCKVNEKAAIERSVVAQAFERAGVAVLVGDWTDGDPALGRFIEAQDRAGVPLYLWYAPGADAPKVLPQVLTPELLVGLAR